MLDALIHFGVYLAEVVVMVIAVLIVVAGIIVLLSKNKLKEKPKIKVRKLNHYYEQLADAIHAAISEKKERKHRKKQRKKHKKQLKKEPQHSKKRIFVMNFQGDIRASAVNLLREEITAILNVATPKDEVILRLESMGGIMHGYGLAASELQRIKDKKIPLIIMIDKIAASGGYLMACVADKIYAAPFAIIGSIGVLAQLPNFNRLLKKHDIDFEQLTAGKYKRTLSLFGENTEEGRKKFQEDINEAHHLFQEFVKQHRSQIDIDKVATGEYWFATKAKKLHLVDELITSDDYLLTASENALVFEIKFQKKKKFLEKFVIGAQAVTQQFISAIKQNNIDENFYL